MTKINNDKPTGFSEQLIAAAEDYYGHPAMFGESGGSIPITSTLAKIGPVVLYAFGPSDSNIHNADERMSVDEMFKGAGAIAHGLLNFKK